MSELLEAVLSEAILDQIASDLGIESDVLRSHPFFRVLKGRVLLTYPLRVPPRYAYNYSIYVDEDYDIADNYTIPAGEELVWVMCTFAIPKVAEIYDGAAWNGIEVAEGVPPAVAADKPFILPHPIYSFGGTEIGSVRVASPQNDDKLLHVCTRTWAEQ